ncbi:GerAB/ArcD/ProY family transporter [Paenibacillus sp. WQ 127069]|uniref:GerAB/ArcD/ProY family transporter n=1 Tax=Paenibacillus baimaensis TaxID=2982185 RepID=A0ABT2U9K6_9BACL|nr:GerAB/ArcD/ProY family transporter [Paenibacillus sp. WQ 127069]MCU6791326.1 GerAB/ArcD/ProY family transporter [Paenibacillus sp. WQ 127069]
MNKNLVLILFLLVHLSLFFYLYPVNIIEAATKGSWEPILVGFLLEALLTGVYLKGLSAFPGKDIVDIFTGVSGKWIARAMLVPYFIFLFVNFNVAHRMELDSVNVVLLPKTPMLFLLLLYGIPFYAAWKGIQSIARGAVIVSVFGVPLILFSLMSGIKNFSFQQIFPLLDTHMTFFSKTQFYSALFAHTGFLFLGMIGLKDKVSMRYIIPVLMMLSFFGLCAVYVPLLIFGPEAIIYLRYPVVLTSDTVDMEWVIFDWLPTFFIISTIAVSMVEAAVSFWIMTTLLQKLFSFRKRGVAIIGLGILSYVFSAMIVNTDWLDRLNSWNTIFCLYSILVIPMMVWMMSSKYRRNSA